MTRQTAAMPYARRRIRKPSREGITRAANFNCGCAQSCQICYRSVRCNVCLA